MAVTGRKRTLFHSRWSYISRMLYWNHSRFSVSLYEWLNSMHSKFQSHSYLVIAVWISITPPTLMFIFYLWLPHIHNSLLNCQLASWTIMLQQFLLAKIKQCNSIAKNLGGVIISPYMGSWPAMMRLCCTLLPADNDNCLANYWYGLLLSLVEPSVSNDIWGIPFDVLWQVPNPVPCLVNHLAPDVGRQNALDI